MACLAVFGRGNGNGAPVPHLGHLRRNPDILADIYSFAGIQPIMPVSTGSQNFRLGGHGPDDRTFTCLEPTCRRVLPLHVAQLDHNTPSSKLKQSLEQRPPLGRAKVTWRNFVHRLDTINEWYISYNYRPPENQEDEEGKAERVARQYDDRDRDSPREAPPFRERDYYDDPPPLRPSSYDGPPPLRRSSRIQAAKAQEFMTFALYYTFEDDTFALVMKTTGVGGRHWAVTVNRAQFAQLHWLIRKGFTLQPMQNSNTFKCISAAYEFEERLELSDVNYSVNCKPAHDLANLQFLCGPCNSTKNADGVPLNLPTFFA
jgi:hypothetical protein